MSNETGHRLILISAICILLTGQAEADNRFNDLNFEPPVSASRHVVTSSADLVAVEPKPKPIKPRKRHIVNFNVDQSEPKENAVTEIRLGILKHDIGPFSSSEESGIDANFEVLFDSPKFLKFIWTPRPHLGVTLNSDDDTNQAYFGLSWEFNIGRKLFYGLSLGGSFHNGEKKTDRTDKKELGCRLLFREALEVGYRFDDRHAITVFLDHLSNANLCDKNEGLENVGLRYGYRF